MNLWGRLGSAAALAVGIAILISWVTGLDRDVLTEDGDPFVVFGTGETVTLTQETIVDELVSLKLYSSIERVSVGNTMMEIDLEVSPDDMMPSRVRADLGELATLTLGRSNNIQRVFIRVMEAKREPSAESVLLVALTGGKSEFSQQELERLRGGERLPEAWLTEKMRMTVTERGRALLH